MKKPEITVEPQAPEQTSLESFKASPETTIGAYLGVSDDKGEVLGNLDMEAIATEYCAMIGDDLTPEKAQHILDKGKKFCQIYFDRTNLAENISQGIITKYRLRWGIILNLQKKALKKTDASSRWSTWFSENYPVEQRRSSQDYMRLAKVPNIIAFSVLGKQNLLKMSVLLEAEYGKDLRLAEDCNDPIGAFLKKSDICFNLDQESEALNKEISYKIDALYSKKRFHDYLRAKGYNQDEFEISNETWLDLAKSLSKPLSNSQFADIIMVRQSKGSIKEHIQNNLLTDLSNQPDVEFRSKVNRLPRILSLFTDILEYIDKNNVADSGLELTTIEEIEAKILSLKSKIQAEQTADEATTSDETAVDVVEGEDVDEDTKSVPVVLNSLVNEDSEAA